MHRTQIVNIVFAALFSVVYCQTKVTKNEDGLGGTIRFSTPDLNDEEGHSPFVPDNLKCDACKAVTFQLWDHFEKYNKLHKYLKYDIKESDLLEITEEVCENQDIFNAYGIKEVNKVHHLAGPGVENDEPGVIAGGGRWPSRLRDMCEDFMGRIGEDKIYKVYKREPDNRIPLENFLCRGPANSVRGECTKVKEHIYDGPGPIHGAKKPGYMEDDEDDFRDEL